MLKVNIHNDNNKPEQNFHLAVQQNFTSNQIHWIYGPSGSGKTTLLRVIAGLKADRGCAVFWNDSAWTQDGKLVVAPGKRNIAFQFQDYGLFPTMSVRKNLSFDQKLDDKELVDVILQQLEIEKLLDKKPKQLSGGERQRVAFARALLQDPELLLLDEPFTALDKKLKSSAIQLFESIQALRKFTVIVVSHDDLSGHCHKSYEIENGAISTSEEIASKEMVI